MAKTTDKDGNPIDFETFRKQAYSEILEGKSLTGKGGVLTPLIKEIVQASLEGELDAHLAEKSGKGNRKNGHTEKTIRTGIGAAKTKNPRDRNSTFEPILIPKCKTVLNESPDDKILGLYALGMSYQDIANHMDEVYGVELSKAMLSAITDKVIPVVRE